MDVEQLKKTLGLTPLPQEGGFYVETFRSGQRLPKQEPSTADSGERSLATAIYFLLTPDSFSALHRLASDEIWHFYLGDPVEMLQLGAHGAGRVLTLGADLDRGMRPQVIVPRGTWQGAKLIPGGDFALLGATVFPGFEFADFELGERTALLATHPQFSSFILGLTR